MTKRKLVIETLAHGNPGKVPQAIDFSCDSYHEALLRDYPNKQARRDYEAGLISMGQAVSLSIGNHILHVSPPWWNWHNLTGVFLEEPDPPDYLPDTRGTGTYEGFFNQLALIREHYDVYIVVSVYGSHWEKAYFARGIENFLADLAGSPEWAQALLDLIIRKNLVMLENFLTAPEVDAVLLGSDWGTQRDLIMSPECFKTMIKPGEKQEYDLIKKYGKQVFIHSCGNILRIMDDLVELGVDCINPVQPECMDLEFLKREYGDYISFYGGISTQTILPYGTPAEVKNEARRVIELMSRNGGYLTSPSQGIQNDVSYDNVRALIDTAGEYWRE